MKPLPGMPRKEQLVVILLVGVLLLIIAIPSKEEKKEEEETDAQVREYKEDDWETEIQSRLQEVLTKVEGVGKTDVFITFEDTGEKVVEKDETDTVFSKDSQGNQTPYLTSEKYPKISGVVIVAQGGDNPQVIRNIQEAVEALFQVEAHKIKVMKMN